MHNFVGPDFASGRFISRVGSDKLTKLHVTTLRHKLAMPSILRRKYSVTNTLRGLAISSPLGNNVPTIELLPVLKQALARIHIEKYSFSTSNLFRKVHSSVNSLTSSLSKPCATIIRLSEICNINIYNFLA